MPLVIELIDNPAVINELIAVARAQYRPIDFQGCGITLHEAKAIVAGR